MKMLFSTLKLVENIKFAKFYWDFLLLMYVNEWASQKCRGEESNSQNICY